MANQDDARVGVYIDFDNIVISRADQARDEGFADATVDLDAILDFASSYGRVTISRAYADWSQKKNADYRDQLVHRAVDLTQMFPVSRTKNGADIRLAIDVVEDLFRHADLTHIVIVAGDSDYIPLAQRTKRLGRTVIGIGVAGSVSRRLAAATDEFHDYDTLLSNDDELIENLPVVAGEPDPEPVRRRAVRAAAPADRSVPAGIEADDDADAADDVPPPPAVGSRRASQLLVRAMRLLKSKNDRDQQSIGEVKSQMLRMEPGFQEARLGYGSFGEFLESRGGLVQVKDGTVQLRGAAQRVAVPDE